MKDWIPLHPGGAQWFIHSFGKDITSLVYTYHKNPEMIKKILAKYETDVPLEKAENFYDNVPPFLKPVDFDLRRDTLTFDFSRKDSILEKVK